MKLESDLKVLNENTVKIVKDTVSKSEFGLEGVKSIQVFKNKLNLIKDSFEEAKMTSSSAKVKEMLGAVDSQEDAFVERAWNLCLKQTLKRLKTTLQDKEKNLTTKSKKKEILEFNHDKELVSDFKLLKMDNIFSIGSFEELEEEKTQEIDMKKDMRKLPTNRRKRPKDNQHFYAFKEDLFCRYF